MREYMFKHKLWLFITVGVRLTGALMQVFIAIIIQQIVDSATSGNLSKFTKVAIFAVVYFLLMGIVEYFTGTTQSMYLKKTINTLREDIFKGILKKDYKDFNSNNTAEYISNLTNDINLVENEYIVPFLMMMGDIIIFIGTVIVLLYINVWVTLILFLTGALMLIVPSTLSKPMEKRQNSVSNSLSSFTKSIKDIFSGYEVIKSYNIEKDITNEFSDKNIDISTKKFKSAHIRAIADALSHVLAIGCQLSGIILSGYFVIKGNLTVGSLVAIMQLGNGINGPIMWIVQKVTQIKGMKGINEKLGKIIDSGKEESKGDVIKSFNDSIILEDVKFSYNEGDTILNGVNYKFEKNKKYAIIGESGCGKSTLIKLLLGYYDDYEGKIILDNKEVKDVNCESLGNLISMIHQNVYMFHRSIKDNIVLWKTFSKEKIEKALEVSGVYKFIDDISEGLESSVGENGSNISGGQKQRVAIARAIIQDTPILILDEGTSALDVKTAYDIESTLLDIEDLTIITVTHKLNEEILSKYDEIIVMNSGTIIESGNYKNLVSQKGEFYDILNAV